MTHNDETPDNDYHIKPVPKGPSALKQVVGLSAGETDKERWARIKLKGFLGIKPADFEWLVEQTRKAVF